jgi:hypothetical protein
MGFIPFVSAIFFTWIRLNRFDERYFASAYIFFPLAAAAALGLVLRRRVAIPARSRLAAGFAVAVLMIGAVILPDRSATGEFRSFEAGASFLESDPNTVALVGGYWGTYLFSGLANREITPVVIDGETDRMPWAEDALAGVKHVWFSHYRDPLFRPLTPELKVIAGNYVLERSPGPQATVNGIVLAPFTVLGRYVSDVSQVDPPLDEVDFCAFKESVDISFPPAKAVNIAISTTQPVGECPLAVSPYSGNTYLTSQEASRSVTATSEAIVISASSDTRTFDGVELTRPGPGKSEQPARARRIFLFE